MSDGWPRKRRGLAGARKEVLRCVREWYRCFTEPSRSTSLGNAILALEAATTELLAAEKSPRSRRPS